MPKSVAVLGRYCAIPGCVGSSRRSPVLVAPSAVLEGLARDLQADPVRVGRVVIAAGEVGDRFYLVSPRSRICC